METTAPFCPGDNIQDKFKNSMLERTIKGKIDESQGNTKHKTFYMNN